MTKIKYLGEGKLWLERDGQPHLAPYSTGTILEVTEAEAQGLLERKINGKPQWELADGAPAAVPEPQAAAVAEQS